MPVRPRDNPYITVVLTDTFDGEPEVGNTQAIVLARETEPGVVQSVGPAVPLTIEDASAPLSGLGPLSAAIPGEGGLFVDHNAARVKIDVMNPGNTRLWVGVGTEAVIGSGNFVDPGGCFTEYTQDAIYLAPQDGNTSSACGQEWGV